MKWFILVVSLVIHEWLKLEWILSLPIYCGVGCVNYHPCLLLLSRRRRNIFRAWARIRTAWALIARSTSATSFASALCKNNRSCMFQLWNESSRCCQGLFEAMIHTNHLWILPYTCPWNTHIYRGVHVSQDMGGVHCAQAARNPLNEGCACTTISPPHRFSKIDARGFHRLSVFCELSGAHVGSCLYKRSEIFKRHKDCIKRDARGKEERQQWHQGTQSWDSLRQG